MNVQNRNPNRTSRERETNKRHTTETKMSLRGPDVLFPQQNREPMVSWNQSQMVPRMFAMYTWYYYDENGIYRIRKRRMLKDGNRH
jgi:hypothetical protein